MPLPAYIVFILEKFPSVPKKKAPRENINFELARFQSLVSKMKRRKRGGERRKEIGKVFHVSHRAISSLPITIGLPKPS